MVKPLYLLSFVGVCRGGGGAITSYWRELQICKGTKLAPFIHVQNNPHDKVNKYATERNNTKFTIIFSYAGGQNLLESLQQFSGWAEYS